MQGSFHSILFLRRRDGDGVDEREEPPYVADLNLDQVLEAMTNGRQQYALEPFFYAPLQEVAAVRYRHDVLRDLEKPDVLASIKNFAEELRRMRDHLAQVEKLNYSLQKRAWFLNALEVYCEAVRSLSRDLASLDVSSRGLQGSAGTSPTTPPPSGSPLLRPRRRR